MADFEQNGEKKQREPQCFGYARCSTSESRQDIDRQKRELKALGVERSENIYWEYESGTKTDRIQLNRLLDTVQAGDTIITTEVSRLTRTMRHLCDIIQDVQDKKIRLIIGSFVADCRNNELDAMSQGMIMMWGVFAQMERQITIGRIKSGLENAKAKGKTLGRHKLTADKLPPKFSHYYKLYKNEEITITEFARMMKRTRQTIYRYIEIYENAG